MAARPITPKRKPRPITDEDRAEILRRHAAGETRNAIARAVGRNGQTVSKIVAQAGGSFDRREETRVATETRQLDLAARRVALANRLQDVAEAELDRIHAPTEYHDWGGQLHEFDVQVRPEPIAADRRAIMATVGTAIDKSLRLVPPVDENGEEAARSMLGALADGLARYAGTDPPEEDAGEG